MVVAGNAGNALDFTVYSERKPLHNLTIHDMINADKQSGNYGISGYYVPDNAWHGERPRTFFSKSKKENIIETEAKSKKDMPGPTSYKLEFDFKKMRGGKFLKDKRITPAEAILKKGKATKAPGPGTYKTRAFSI